MSLDTTVISASHRPSAIVIDGDEVAQKVLASFLRALEWDVRVASDGAQGLVIDITAMTSGNARLQVARVAASGRSAS